MIPLTESRTLKKKTIIAAELLHTNEYLQFSVSIKKSSIILLNICYFT